jgi:hypothetical protein
MYPDHAPPHFHLLGPGWSAVVEIDGLTLSRGWAPPRELGEALEWARDNHRLLAEKWEELNERG